MITIRHYAFLSIISYTAFAYPALASEPIAVAFDIHNVLVVPDTVVRSAAIKQIVRSAISSICADLGRTLIGYAGERRPYALCGRLIQLLLMGDISGEGFAVVCEKYGYPELSAQVKVISQAYDPVPDIEKVLKELTEQDVYVMVASNIGTQFYGILAHKNDKTEALFDNFNETDPGITVEFVKPNGTLTHKPIKKPDSAYFKKVLQKAYKHGAQRVIFLDDKENYVKQAQKNGLESFQFDARKHKENAAQVLRKELINRNILLKK